VVGAQRIGELAGQSAREGARTRAEGELTGVRALLLLDAGKPESESEREATGGVTGVWWRRLQLRTLTRRKHRGSRAWLIVCTS
jgi:hypothetical protein